MIKYVPEMTSVVIEEIPDKVTLAVDISNCQGNCEGCHSPFLRMDVGEELTSEVIDSLVEDNYGVNCFLFLGEGNDLKALLGLAGHVRSIGLKVALYSGRQEVEDEIYRAFDYVLVLTWRSSALLMRELRISVCTGFLTRASLSLRQTSLPVSGIAA